jgi:hypothetical protein
MQGAGMQGAGLQGGMGGPATPPPQPITPPPMPMYQGGMQQPPPPNMGQPRPPMQPPMQPHMQPPMQQPPYGPPPRKSSAGPIIAIGCGVLALIVIVVVVVIAIAAANSDNDDPTPTYTNTYTPPGGDESSPPSTSRGGLVGVWEGTGYQPGVAAGSRNFSAKFALVYTYGTATYDYSGSQPTCYTKLSLLSGDENSSMVEYQETPMAGQKTDECAPGYVRFVSPGGSTMRWEWRENRSDPTASASGIVHD